MAIDKILIPGTWYAVRVRLPAAAEDDAVGIVGLCGAGANARPAGRARVELTAWFGDAGRAASGASALGALDGAKLLDTTPAAVEDPGWLAASEAPREPIAAGRFLVEDGRTASRHRARGTVQVVVPPGLAFGTGEHQTTRMCLELLDGCMAGGERVLDVGTGSGILAIAAVKGGAASALAIDDDAQVVPVARENAAANGVGDAVEVRHGSWPAVPRGARFAIVLANIHRTALVRGARPLAARLAPGGHAIVSGFLEDDLPRVAAAWERAGCSLGATVRDRGWVAARLDRSREPEA